ncbi:phosphoribosylanthranilate isomerase [Desulfotomaculum defluvii]
MTKIKICGLTRVCDIEAVNEALPDFVGFVFADSKRRIKPQDAIGLKNLLDKKIQAVGVFVNEDIANIADICLRGIIDIVQLHGQEDVTYMEKLQQEIEKPVIKAVGVRSREDIRAAETLTCQYLLLDTYSAKQAGGTGKTFDWNIVDEVKKPYFLAGGLNSNNILQAIKTVRPFGVDISSGVEVNGFKDKDKILEIVKLIRSTEQKR